MLLRLEHEQELLSLVVVESSVLLEGSVLLKVEEGEWLG